jgi:23S rRNA (guanosine2251-2'-O)-methyltransferase
VASRLRHAPASIQEVYVEASRRDKRMQALVDQVQAATKITVQAVASDRLDHLSRGVHHQGVVAIVTPVTRMMDVEEVLAHITEPAFLLLLDGVTDPHNLGACLRTADATGVHAVIAPRDRAVGLTSTVQRVACGAADTVPYIVVTNLARTMQSLKDQGVYLVGTSDQVTTPLYDVDVRQPMAWVLGAEGEGLRRLTRVSCDALVQIPMLGSVESLNVSVASAVCLYETVRQRQLKG